MDHRYLDWYLITQITRNYKLEYHLKIKKIKKKNPNKLKNNQANSYAKTIKQTPSVDLYSQVSNLYGFTCQPCYAVIIVLTTKGHPKS